MGSADMSARTHWVVRLVALAIIAAAAWLPRSSSTTGAAAVAADSQAIHASVAVR